MLSENTIRRRLHAKGLRLEKTPSLHWTRAAYGPGYMVIDDRNTVVLGASQRPYDGTLAEAAELAGSLAEAGGSS